MFEKSKIAKKARKIVVDTLKNDGWKVRNRASGESIYTTPSGRISTLSLQLYADGGFWRWHIDRMVVRIPGQLKMAEPCPPRGMSGDKELTVFEDELVETAEWLAHWMIAAEAGQELPVCPVALEKGDLGTSNDVWTEQASTAYDRLRR